MLSMPDPSAEINLSVETSHQMILSRISHELRNPIALLNSFLQLLEEEYPYLTEDIYYKKISETVDYIKLLLNDLSSFNRSSHLNLQNVDLGELFLCVTDSVKHEFLKNNIRICLQIQTDLPFLPADPVKLRQLLDNLLQNAAEAIRQDGEITCLVYQRRNSICFTIRDTGPGIPEEFHKTLFDPFVTHKVNGTGLGLTICKNIVEAHHGSISMDPSLEQGAAFTVIFPLGL